MVFLGVVPRTMGKWTLARRYETRHMTMLCLEWYGVLPLLVRSLVGEAGTLGFGWYVGSDSRRIEVLLMERKGIVGLVLTFLCMV